MTTAHWEQSTLRVLTMDYIDGVSINDCRGLSAAGLNLTEIAGRLLYSFLEHIFHFGFFHVDPHAGNFLVRTNAVINFVDLPGDVQQMVDKINSDKLSIDFVHRGLEFLIGELDRSSNRIAIGLITTAPDHRLQPDRPGQCRTKIVCPGNVPGAIGITLR